MQIHKPHRYSEQPSEEASIRKALASRLGGLTESRGMLQYCIEYILGVREHLMKLGMDAELVKPWVENCVLAIEEEYRNAADSSARRKNIEIALNHILNEGEGVAEARVTEGQPRVDTTKELDEVRREIREDVSRNVNGHRHRASPSSHKTPAKVKAVI